MTEARTDSLYQRLAKRGLLDTVMRAMLDGEKSPKEMVRWLKAEGVECSQSAVYNLFRTHGFQWRYDQSREAALSMALPDDMDAAAAMLLRRKVQSAVFEADSLKELEVLARIHGDTEKLAQAERKVALAEKEAQRKVLATQLEGAEFLDAVLSEAAKVEALRKMHADSVKAGQPVKERLRLIMQKVWGDQVPTGAESQKGGES